MSLHHDRFEDGREASDSSGSIFVKRAAIAVVGAVIIGYALVPDIIHLASGALTNP